MASPELDLRGPVLRLCDVIKSLRSAEGWPAPGQRLERLHGAHLDPIALQPAAASQVRRP